MINKKRLEADNEAVGKVAIYIRVSTEYQIDKDSLPMQRKDLVAYSELILGITDYDIFEDAGYSGKNTDRPAYQEMMSRIRNREFSHLLVWKIDRISRNLLDFSEMYKELKQLHVVFVSKNEQFDTSTAMGEAMLKIILVFAELERNMTSERVTATMISRANNGLWNGGKIPYGYTYDGERFAIFEEEAAVCRTMKDDYLKHKSLLHTSKMLNEQQYRTRSGAEWSPTTCHLILSSPFYAGIYRYNRYKGTENRTVNPQDEWVVVPNHHAAIFSTEEHAQILAIMKKNKRMQNTSDQCNLRKNIHVFAGLCFCGRCHFRMVATPGRLQADGYRTSTYTCAKKRKTRDCQNPSVNDLIIGDFVINYISNIIKAKQHFSQYHSLEELQTGLLTGYNFANITRIDQPGLGELYDLLCQYKSDNSFKLLKPRKKKSETNPEVATLKKECDRQRRALKRLQDLYLYSDNPMPHKDFLIRTQEINIRLNASEARLRQLNAGAENSLSDEEFIRKASYLLLSARLQDAEYISYKTLATSIPPDILKEYVQSIIECIYIDSGSVTGIVFRNGIYHRFVRKEKE